MVAKVQGEYETKLNGLLGSPAGPRTSHGKPPTT